MSYDSTPPPFPSGWYCLGLSRDVRPGEIVNHRFMGEDIVVFRTQQGVPSVMEAYCPHLGAHLGKGGKVCDESIRCPFHHFKFDTEGKCVETGYGTHPPAKAVAKTWPVIDRNGLLMAYHSQKDEAPTWEIPELDWAGWSPMLSRVWDMRGHPQETSENSVDVGHFDCIHGYSNVRTIREAKAEGPYLGATYGMERPIIRTGNIGKLEVEFDIHVHGFGYSLVEVTVKNMGIRTRQYVLSCPKDEDRIDFRICLSAQSLSKNEDKHAAMKLLPSALFTPLIAHFAFQGFVHDVKQDFPMWENKRYVVPPALAKGDGPVGIFRRYAKQFYDGAQDQLQTV